MQFPKVNANKLKGVTGQAYFQYFVNQHLNCIYYPVAEENDFGIDGYIGLVIDGRVTGKLLGVQIKHGNSYFKSTTKQGYQYFGDIKQLNYYSNSQEPIFIIIMDDNFEEMNWVQFDVRKTKLVNPSKWWIEIPSKNQMKNNLKEALLNAVSPVIDFEKEMQLSKDFELRGLNYKKCEILKNRTTQKMRDYKRMGEMIRNRRRKLGITQEKLAEKVEISSCYIGEIERGTSLCSLAVIVKIAIVLRLSLDNLLIGNNRGDTENPFSEILDSIAYDNRKIYLKICEDIAHVLK